MSRRSDSLKDFAIGVSITATMREQLDSIQDRYMAVVKENKTLNKDVPRWNGSVQNSSGKLQAKRNQRSLPTIGGQSSGGCQMGLLTTRYMSKMPKSNADTR